jgi:hypothetical protein
VGGRRVIRGASSAYADLFFFLLRASNQANATGQRAKFNVGVGVVSQEPRYPPPRILGQITTSCIQDEAVNRRFRQCLTEGVSRSRSHEGTENSAAYGTDQVSSSCAIRQHGSGQVSWCLPVENFHHAPSKMREPIAERMERDAWMEQPIWERSIALKLSDPTSSLA